MTSRMRGQAAGWDRTHVLSDASKVCCFGFLERAILRGRTDRLLGLPSLGDWNLTRAGESP